MTTLTAEDPGVSRAREGDDTAAAGSPYDAWSINVLTLRQDRIAEITSFLGAEHFATFGLPTSLP